jgi:selenocysteine lyase/cysteine desulfurase
MDRMAWIRDNLIGKRALFDTPFGTRRLTYADYVASGRSLAYIEQLLQEQVLPFYANSHTEDSFTGAHTTHLTHQAAEYIKACLGATQFKIIFCGSGSTAAIKRLQEILGLAVPSNLRARVLETLKPQERPVVFVGPYEHHSNEVSWRESLAQVVELPLNCDGGICLETLEAALSDPQYAGRTKIGSFSAASNVTGLLSDTRAIAHLLHRHGAWACFDFAASAPYVEIDMRPGQPDGYDAIFISPHKFVGGPGTPGLLVFNPAMYQLSAPSTPGGGTVTYVSSSAHRFTDDIESREDAGTPAIVQKMRAALAFWVKEQVGTQKIAEREHALIRGAIKRLAQNPKIELLGNLEAPRLAVVSFLIRSGQKYLHPRFVVRLLSDLFGIQCRGGCACAGPYGHRLLNIDEATSRRYLEAVLAHYEGVKPGWTRLNFNYFIEDEEFNYLLDAVEFVAQYGERFLGLYDFDWQSGAWRHQEAKPHPSLFDLPEVREDTGPVPYRRYLNEALALAQSLHPGPEQPIPVDLPSAVAAELVFFRR